MNYPKRFGFGLILLCYCTLIQAQEDRVLLREPDHNKPALFKQLPDKLPVEVNELNHLFSPVAAKGDHSSPKFLDKQIPGFEGQIVSATSKYNNTLRSVVVKSTRINGATLTLSSSTASDGTTRYSGRIVSFQHGDVYVLENNNGEYIFVRKKFHELVSE